MVSFNFVNADGLAAETAISSLVDSRKQSLTWSIRGRLDEPGQPGWLGSPGCLSARYYMRRASPAWTNFRICHVKKDKNNNRKWPLRLWSPIRFFFLAVLTGELTCYVINF